MNSMIEFRVMELLCSRLCHDLISPVMAVNNGMELLEDEPGPISDDIRDLLATSAAAAAAKLQYYRIAYGLGGQNAAPVGLEEAGRLARGMIEDGKVELDWPGPSSVELPREGVKLLLNMVLLGFESLPRGGALKVRINGAAAPEIIVSAAGTGAGLRQESADAMAAGADLETLTARSVQGYFVTRLADLIGARTSVDDSSEDAVILSAVLPA